MDLSRLINSIRQMNTICWRVSLQIRDSYSIKPIQPYWFMATFKFSHIAMKYYQGPHNLIFSKNVSWKYTACSVHLQWGCNERNCVKHVTYSYRCGRLGFAAKQIKHLALEQAHELCSNNVTSSIKSISEWYYRSVMDVFLLLPMAMQRNE